MRCGCCGSTNVQIDIEQKSGYSVKKGILGRLFFGAGGEVAGVNGKQETKKTYHCLACGKIGSLVDVVMSDYTEGRINKALSSNNINELKSLKQQYRNIECGNININNESDSILSALNGATEIKIGQFINNTAITSVIIPDSVKIINADAFRGCTSLKYIEFGSGVELIDNYAFLECPSLEKIKVNPNNANFKSEGNCLLSKNGKELLLGCKGSEIPDSVTEIEWRAFSGAGFSTILIPKNVKEIGYYAFENCTSLRFVTILGNEINIGSSAFEGCNSLIEVEIRSENFSIGSSAFKGCSSLNTVKIIKGGQQLIFKSAFSGCTTLEKIILPKNILLDNSVFEGCTSLTIYCEAEEQPSEWRKNWNFENRPVVWGYKEDNKF